MPTLFLRPRSRTAGEESNVLDWYVFEQNQHQQGLVGQGEVTLAGNPVDDEMLAMWPTNPAERCLVIANEEVLLLSCQVPGRRISSIRQALPYALEDYVASDIERNHIAHDTIKPGQPIHCAVIKEETLLAWRELLSDHNISVANMFSQAQLLAAERDQATLLFGPDGEAQEVLVVADGQSAEVPRSELPSIVEALSAVDLMCVNGELSDLEAGQLDRPVTTSYYPGNSDEYLYQCFLKGGWINLLQGKYKVRQNNSAIRIGLNKVAALAALWFIVAVVAVAIEGAVKAHRAQTLEAQNIAAYRAIFPTNNPPSTTAALRRRLQSKVSTRGTQPLGDANASGFVDLLARMSDSLDRSTQVQSLRYSEQRMELNAEVLIAGFSELDAIKQRSITQGIVLETADAVQEDSQVRARLKGSYSR